MVTIRQFLETGGLYKWQELIKKKSTPHGFRRVPPALTLRCEQCEKETTWNLSEVYLETRRIQSNYSEVERGINHFIYVCRDCGETFFEVWVKFKEEDVTEEEEKIGIEDRIKLMKIGQNPPPFVKIPKGFENFLGNTVEFYKKAISCRNEGYGLACISYFRRVIEDTVNDIIDLIIEEVGPEEDKKRLESIKGGKAADKKLDEIKSYIPRRLIAGGQNPLEVLYGLFSIDLHDASDDDCINTFDESRKAFDYVFMRLHADRGARDEFEKYIKSRAGKSKRD